MPRGRIANFSLVPVQDRTESGVKSQWTVGNQFSPRTWSLRGVHILSVLQQLAVRRLPSSRIFLSRSRPSIDRQIYLDQILCTCASAFSQAFSSSSQFTEADKMDPVSILLRLVPQSNLMLHGLEFSLAAYTAFRAYLFLTSVLDTHFMASVQLESRDPHRAYVENYLADIGSK